MQSSNDTNKRARVDKFVTKAKWTQEGETLMSKESAYTQASTASRTLAKLMGDLYRRKRVLLP